MGERERKRGSRQEKEKEREKLARRAGNETEKVLLELKPTLRNYLLLRTY